MTGRTSSESSTPTYSLSPSGWPLIRSPRTIQNANGARSGYKNVSSVQHSNRKKPALNPWQAKDNQGGSLGLYRTPEAAAEAYSRHLGMEAACLLAQTVEDSFRSAPMVAMTEEEAFRLAAAEGLTLRRSSKYASGFEGVTMPGSVLRPYCVYGRRLPGEDKKRSLGTFVTAAEAALVYARAVRKAEEAMQNR